MSREVAAANSKGSTIIIALLIGIIIGIAIGIAIH
jgi:hypothetical protein